MKFCKQHLASWFIASWFVVLACTACNNHLYSAPNEFITPSSGVQTTSIPGDTPTPDIINLPIPSATNSLDISTTPTSPNSLATVSGSATPIPTTTPAVEPSRTPLVTPCGTGQCFYSGTLFLGRPIASPGVDYIDISYRFGSTQNQQRPPHHGVEFQNSPGTAVLAAADGVVVIAGTDEKQSYGPFRNFYGNLVVLQHAIQPDIQTNNPDFPTPIYTLYGHLSKISVEPGQIVRKGQEVGQVGMTGNATGNHLHFEVRLGENTYQAARNPELWLEPRLGGNGPQSGAIAGRVIDERGRIIPIEDIIVQYLPEGPNGPTLRGGYLDSYEEESLLGQSPWQESFAIGDLPPGWYRISFTYLGVQIQEVQVFPGQISMVVFSPDD